MLLNFQFVFTDCKEVKIFLRQDVGHERYNCLVMLLTGPEETEWESKKRLFVIYFYCITCLKADYLVVSLCIFHLKVVWSQSLNG
jgi:membrane associated rhomboid family serine protease